MSWAKTASDTIRQHWIPHPKFRQAESESLAALLTADPGEIVCIVGPSRVGKSALVDRISSSLVGTATGDGSMPLVTIVVENDNTDGTLSSKSFTASGLLAVRHPIFGMNSPGDLWGIERMHKIRRTPENALRSAFERALEYRHTKYVVIDEAHHLLYARGGVKTAGALLDSVKCLAARAKVVVILVGAYPLLELIVPLPHLIGRKLQVHFPRYHADVEHDVAIFNRILLEYSSHLHFEGNQSLQDWNEYLYQGSLGCLGLLRGWIRDALNKAWVSGASALTLEHFELSSKSHTELASVTAEILVGEERLRRIALNLAMPEIVDRSESKQQKSRARKTFRPGIPNPRRYAVGKERDNHGQ